MQPSDAQGRVKQTPSMLARMIVGRRDIDPLSFDRCQGQKARRLDEAGPPRALPPPYRLLGTRACAAASRPFGTRPSNSARAGTGRTSARRPAFGRTSGTAVAARCAHAHRSTLVRREVSLLRMEQAVLARGEQCDEPNTAMRRAGNFHTIGGSVAGFCVAVFPGKRFVRHKQEHLPRGNIRPWPPKPARVSARRMRRVPAV